MSADRMTRRETRAWSVLTSCTDFAVQWIGPELRCQVGRVCDRWPRFASIASDHARPLRRRFCHGCSSRQTADARLLAQIDVFVRRRRDIDAGHAVGLKAAADDVEFMADEGRGEAVPRD